MKDRARAIRFVQGVHRTLSTQRDLSPDNEIVTECLKGFVAFLTAAFDEDWAQHLPDDPELSGAAARLPLLCGLAECEMEKWWCRRFLAKRELLIHDLAEFWYFENYRHLVAAELSLLAPESFDRAVLLGSGALPLTAVHLAQRLPHLRILCVDRDRSACDLAGRLAEKLGLSSRIEISLGPAESSTIRADDAVICASLLDAPHIHRVFAKMLVGRFIVRDAEGLFRLCYRKVFSPPPNIYRLERRTNASPSRINISCLYRLSNAVRDKGITE